MFIVDMSFATESEAYLYCNETQLSVQTLVNKSIIIVTCGQQRQFSIGMYRAVLYI